MLRNAIVQRLPLHETFPQFSPENYVTKRLPYWDAAMYVIALQTYNLNYDPYILDENDDGGPVTDGRLTLIFPQIPEAGRRRFSRIFREIKRMKASEPRIVLKYE